MPTASSAYVLAARMGAHVSTCPPSVIDALFKHPLMTLQTMVTLNPRALVSRPGLYRELFYSPTLAEEKLSKYLINLETVGSCR